MRPKIRRKNWEKELCRACQATPIILLHLLLCSKRERQHKWSGSSKSQFFTPLIYVVIVFFSLKMISCVIAPFDETPIIYLISLEKLMNILERLNTYFCMNLKAAWNHSSSTFALIYCFLLYKTVLVILTMQQWLDYVSNWNVSISFYGIFTFRCVTNSIFPLNQHNLLVSILPCLPSPPVDN